VLAFYGDDFTGSCDSMEVLQWAGLDTVLFLDSPTAAQLAAFPNMRAVGIAGCSRTMSPLDMEHQLGPALASLRDSGAAIVHYKTCSTFDSSPQIGSIGKAIEIGRSHVGGSLVPIFIAAPQLGRYQAFGNLFARSGLDSLPFRLDRHPTMSRHPITPMCEADVREHLRQQTDLRFELIDCLQLASLAQRVDNWESRYEAEGVLFDAIYPEHVSLVGAALDSMAHTTSPKFMVGSSGIEYALTSHWCQTGRMSALQSSEPVRPRFGPAQQLMVITGSCSPVNDRQLGWAEQHGFELIELNTARLLPDETRPAEMERAIELSLRGLRRGANVIVHSARGPGDSRVNDTLRAFQDLGFSQLDIKLCSGRMLGPLLGNILKTVLQAHPCARVGVAGGDTSGYIARELELFALQAIAPVAPGSPLCRGHAANSMQGVEFFFKGGQVGKDDVWSTMLHGTLSS
jgi:uncharacterized protein YgbK (DUF1537 family)